MSGTAAPMRGHCPYSQECTSSRSPSSADARYSYLTPARVKVGSSQYSLSSACPERRLAGRLETWPLGPLALRNTTGPAHALEPVHAWCRASASVHSMDVASGKV